MATFATIYDGGEPGDYPLEKHKRQQSKFNNALYRQRNQVERCFSRLKRYHRITTRHKKKAGKNTELKHALEQILLEPNVYLRDDLYSRQSRVEWIYRLCIRLHPS